MDEEFYIAESLKVDKEGILFLADLWEKIESFSGGKVLLHFDEVKDIDANLSAALGAILDSATKKGTSMFLNAPREKTVKRALARIGFLGAFSVQTNVKERENFIMYKCFSVLESSEFKEYIHTGLIQKQRFPQCTQKAEEKIIESIYEVFANAVSNGGCENVYSCGECHELDKRPMLDMTITNLGRSIQENVNNFLCKRGKSPLSAEDTLKWAFKEGNTTKDVPGGLGLAILKDFMDLNEGEIQMASGNALLEYKKGCFDTAFLEKPFPGTIVNLKFNCADQKAYSLKNEITNSQDLL